MHVDHEEALRSDGDGYHSRNYAGIGTIADPIFEQLKILHLVTPITSILEIGCTTGFRLEKARKAFGASCSGLDISSAAIEEGQRNYPQIDLQVGLAPRDLEKWNGREFEVVVLGHFLYLLPRDDLFAVAASVDQLLASGGHLIIMDFLHPHPISADYRHHENLRVFKHDPSAPWLWSPSYVLVSRNVYQLADDPTSNSDPRTWQTVDVLRKLSIDEAYPHAATIPSVHSQLNEPHPNM